MLGVDLQGGLEDLKTLLVTLVGQRGAQEVTGGAHLCHRHDTRVGVQPVRDLWRRRVKIYYPPGVRSMKYCCLGVFRKEYFRLITK